MFLLCASSLSQTQKTEEEVHCPQAPGRLLLLTPAAAGEPFSHHLPVPGAAFRSFSHGTLLQGTSTNQYPYAKL